MSQLQNKHIFLFLISLSIAHLKADTNTPTTQENTVQELTAEQAKEFVRNLSTQQVKNPFVEECITCAEYLDMIIHQLLSININQGMRLAKPLEPVLGYCNGIKQLPATASAQELYQALSLLNECTTYIIKAIEDLTGKIEEFLPLNIPKENLSPQDFEEISKKLETNFNVLLQKAREVNQDFIGNLLMNICNQLSQLDRILHTINNNVDNSKIVNKKDIKREIVALRNDIHMVQKEVAGAGSNPEAIKGAFQYNKAILTYLADVQAHKYRKWSLMELASALKRSRLEEDISMGELFIDIMITNAELDKLEKNAEKIDLTLTNKAARFVGDYVIDPIYRHDLGLYSLAALATVGSGAYFAYAFDQTFFTDPTSKFRKCFGYPDPTANKMVSIPRAELAATIVRAFRLDPKLLEQMNLDQLQAVAPATTYEEQVAGMLDVKFLEAALTQAKRRITNGKIPISKFDQFLSEYKTGIAAIGVGLFGLAGYAYYKLWTKHNGEWRKKLNVWFEKLKGGAIAKNAEKYDMVISSITFDDIIGLEYEKSLIYPHLKYIKDPERWDANGLTPPTGILLTGPTRAGKTFFAKAICGEIHRQNPDKQIRFVSIDVHDIKADGINTWMGVAKMLAPCVLFIDEIDLLGLQRSQDKSLLSDFLQALSGITEKDPKRQVIVVGTTNKPENIDTALIQSGRFALEIRFKYPNLKERKEFILKRLEKFAIDPEVFEIDVDKLARETHEKSFEDIKLMMDTAFIQVGIKGQIISQDILESALDVQLRRVIDIDTKQISETEKRLIAAHYAGQTLTHILLKMEEKIAKATIRQAVVKVKEESVWNQYDNKDHQKQIGLDHGAVFTYFEHDSYDIKNEAENIKKAKTFLGARIAERILTNNCSIHFGWKKNAAYNLIKAIVADGIDIKSISESRQNAICDETDTRLRDYEKEVEVLLREHIDALAAIAQELYVKQTLSIDQINHIIEKVEKQEMASAIPSAA